MSRVWSSQICFGTDISAVNSKADHHRIPVLLGLLGRREFTVIEKGDKRREMGTMTDSVFLFFPASTINLNSHVTGPPPKPDAG